jgi:hypothetical protein
MLDHEEAVKQLEGHRRDGEKIECGDHLAVILEKREPPLTRVAAAPDTSQIARHAPL